jgi:PAS domain S-box-containing protein
MCNLDPLVDAMFHPEIPYFDEEHLIVGGIIGFLSIILFGLLILYVRHLDNALRKIKTLSQSEIEQIRALRESEKRFSDIAENASEWIWEVDATGKYTYTNPVVEKLLGYAPQEILEKHFYDLFHPEDQEELKRVAFAAFSAGRPFQEFLNRNLHKNGKVLWLLTSGVPILDGQGNLLGYRGADINITARRQAEEALKESERFLADIFDNLQDGLCVLDPDLNIRRVNPTMEEWFPQRHPLQGQKCYFAYHGRETPCEVCPTRETLKTGKAAHKMVPHPVGVGEAAKWMEIYTYPLLAPATEQIAGVIEYVRDVTERKLAEEALRQANEKLTALIQASPLAIIGIDTEGRVTSWNPAAERIFGWTREEVLGRLLPIVPEKRLEHFHRVRHSELGGECLVGMELDALDRQGSLVDIKLFTAGLYTADGKVAGEVAIIEDISAYQRAQEALREREEQLRQAQKMEAVGRLAGGVAHDFNNILTAISGYAELLLPGMTDQESLQEVREIQEAAQRAASLTRQLLAFSRKQVFQPKVLDLNRVLKNLDKMLRRVISEDIDLVFFPGEGLGRVLVDPVQIEQVIMNLAVNARDAMPAGGKLTLETANVDLDEAYVSDHLEVQPGPYVVLSVSDTGIGLDEATRGRLFEPFFTTKGQGKGTGLGLSTVYGIVKQSGGHIWVYSETGQGTTFKIYLPRVDGSGETADACELPRPLAAGSETVLLVEDEDLVRQVVRRILERHGYTVLAADRGPEALRISEGFPGPIHLVLTDVVMPEMSGRETVEAVRLNRREIRVLYMSGHTENAIVRHGVLEPGIAFIQKPFRHEELLARMREVLDSPPLASDSPAGDPQGKLASRQS